MCGTRATARRAPQQQGRAESPRRPRPAGLPPCACPRARARGLDGLRRVLLDIAGWQSAPEGIYTARARHLEALRAVDMHLMEAAAQLQCDGPALDLLAEELRLAQQALNAITGEFTSDDLLGVIFSSFCIGK